MSGAHARALHVIVGHGLPALFLNSVSSAQAVLPGGPLLVVDNASPQPGLVEQLRQKARHPGTQYMRREDNELANTKVGGLYSAYRQAFELALAEGYGFVHLMQADMQVLWWDDDALEVAEKIYALEPRCINIVTMALSRDRRLGGELTEDTMTGLTRLTRYGITDTGLFSLERWAASGMTFGPSESAHGQEALRRGHRAIVFPSPTEVQVPWPAVVRNGRQKGREVRTPAPFLCRPLDLDAKSRLKAAASPVTMEELCVPWGWACLTPMWNSDLDNVYYLAARRKDVKLNGWRRGLPHWERRGLDRRWQFLVRPRRPSLFALGAGTLSSLLRERRPPGGPRVGP